MGRQDTPLRLNRGLTRLELPLDLGQGFFVDGSKKAEPDDQEPCGIIRESDRNTESRHGRQRIAIHALTSTSALVCSRVLAACRGVAQPGSAPALGAGSPRFESGRPDHFNSLKQQGFWAHPENHQEPTSRVQAVFVRRLCEIGAISPVSLACDAGGPPSWSRDTDSSC